MESKGEIYLRCVLEHPLGRKEGLTHEQAVKFGFEVGIKAMDEYLSQKTKPLTDKVIAVESAKYSDRIGVNPISAKLDFEAGMKKACELIGIDVITTKMSKL